MNSSWTPWTTGNPLPVGTYVAWRDHSDDLALIIRSGPLVPFGPATDAPMTVRLRWMILDGEVLSCYKYQDVEYPTHVLRPLTELEVLSRLGGAKKNPSGRAATLSLQISEAKESLQELRSQPRSAEVDAGIIWLEREIQVLARKLRNAQLAEADEKRKGAAREFINSLPTLPTRFTARASGIQDLAFKLNMPPLSVVRLLNAVLEEREFDERRPEPEVRKKKKRKKRKLRPVRAAPVRAAPRPKEEEEEEEDKKVVPNFIRPDGPRDVALAQAGTVKRFLAKAYHTDKQELRAQHGLDPLNWEWHSIAGWTYEGQHQKAVEAFNSGKEDLQLAYRLDQELRQIEPRIAMVHPDARKGLKKQVEALKRKLQAADNKTWPDGNSRYYPSGLQVLNTMLQPFLGTADDPEPHIKIRGQRIEVELPGIGKDRYVPRHIEAQVLKGRAGAMAAATIQLRRATPGFGDAQKWAEREKKLRDRAETSLRKAYSARIWRLMRSLGLQEDRIGEVAKNWLTGPGKNLGFVTRSSSGELVFTDRFDETAAGFNESIETLAREVRNKHRTEDKAALGLSSLDAADLWHTHPMSAEEQVEYRRGEGTEALHDARRKWLDDHLANMEAAGEAGQAKADLIRMHMGYKVVRTQPERLLGRMDVSGVRHPSTSRAVQDLIGQKWRLNRRGNLILKSEAERSYHPIKEGDSCPTCKAIARFVHVRGMGPTEVAAIIDEFVHVLKTG